MHSESLSGPPAFGSKYLRSVLALLVPTLLLLFAIPATADEPAKPAESKPAEGKADDNKALQNKAPTEKAAQERAKERFVQADKNGDGKLSPDEFVVGRGDEPTARRDFKLFDFDRDGALSPAEFAPIAVNVIGVERGAMPDPFITRLVDVVLAALDKSLKNWNEHPEIEYNATEFVRQVSQRLNRIFPDDFANLADADHNGRVNRAEARRFFEIQFGARHRDGHALRNPNAMYVNYNLFLHTDLNRDGILDKKEFTERSYGGDKSEQEFGQLDADKNGSLSFEEFKVLPRAHKDPIEEFRQIDKNLDAKIDAQEMMSGLADWKKVGSGKYVVGAFDIDHDGGLSLEEWMVTPQANELMYWFGAMRDADGDKKLALNEFAFDQHHFVLLRLFFFRRFDRNGDNFLDQNEYEFRLRKPFSLYSINADGTDLKKIDCGEIARVNAPCVSPDGKWVAFDGAANLRDNQLQWSTMVVPIDGGEVKKICTGLSPTWSKDGLKLACSRYQPQQGTWIMDLVGEDDHFVGQGWGAQWSPDGKKIFFNQGNTLKSYDVETQEAATVLPASSTEYRAFDQGAAWSPDSKRICIWGLKQNAWDALIIDMDSKDKEPADRVKARFTGHGAGSDFAWSPDGRRIVCTQSSEERKVMQLYEFDPDTDDPPKLFPGQPEDQHASGASWTPDGKRLVFTAGDH